MPFHYGILIVTLGHFVAFLIPRTLLAWNSVPLRLYVLEVTALAFGILTVIGLIGIIVRRFGSSKVRVVTTPTDWLLFAMLLVQTVSGVSIALFLPVGFVVVRYEHGTLFVVDYETRPRCQFRRGDAVANKTTCRTGVFDDWFLPVYSTRACVGYPKPLSLA